MEKSKKKFKWWIVVFCAVLLAIILFLAACIIPYLAHRGQIGPNVYYAFNHRTGTAIIYGKGSTYWYQTTYMSENFKYQFDPVGTTVVEQLTGVTHYFPNDSGELNWSPLTLEARNASMRKVIVLPGVTALDTGFVQDCIDLRAIYLPDTIEYFSALAINADGAHDRTSLTVYFGGDAPRITLSYGDSPPSFGLYDVTVVHRPDTSGWEGPSWAFDETDPYCKAVEVQDFSVNWLPLF